MILSFPSENHSELLLCLLFSALVTLMARHAFSHDSVKWRERYIPFAGALPYMMTIIILFNVFLLLAGLLFPGVILPSLTDNAHLNLFQALLSMLFSYAVLYFIIPVLRKHFHPAFCAACWLLPNIIYFAQAGITVPFAGLIALVIDPSPAKILSIIWLAGFLSVMIYRIVSHLRFRKALLKNCREITGGHVYDIYTQLLKDFRAQNVYPLSISPALRTPLSIGIAESTAVILLPDMNYSDEQLRLILSHELIHIQRRDPFTKFFMCLINAAGWFIPFTWMSSERAAQDLELSCDQTVISHCSEPERKEYADLILSSAADETGFTTCLAAKAKDLQYRLHQIVNPEKKQFGTVLIFLISFAILSGYGVITLAEDCGTIADRIEEMTAADKNQEYWDVTVNGKPLKIDDEKGFGEWISSKELLQTADRVLTKNDSLADDSAITVIHLLKGDERLVLLFNGRAFRIWNANSNQGRFYVLKEPFTIEELKQFAGRT